MYITSETFFKRNNFVCKFIFGIKEIQSNGLIKDESIQSAPNLGQITSGTCQSGARLYIQWHTLQGFKNHRDRGDLRRLGFWEPVLTRIKNRLSEWKSCFLSFGGRLILLKSVLTSIPVYALSFFIAPSCIISSIDFFFGSVGKTICSRKEYGGLGVRVLAARYGTGRGRVIEGGVNGSSWWREIVNILEGRGYIGGGRFGDCVSENVGDGSGTLFWTDPWLEGIPLSERFGRLVDLDVNKSSSIVEMFALQWEVGGEAWEWRRELWAWEEELQPDLANGYSIRSAYQILTSQEIEPLSAAVDVIWHKQVALKVSILVWRIMRDRLPTKENLAAQDIITPVAHLCVSGCGDIESAQHIFLSCNTFGSLWSFVRSWIGFSAADPQSVPDHFLQFTYSLGGTRARRSFL
ncbi:hypothetical protein TSUD_148930 [Trifolium subterraneum]|uniref:Reverse transcriptase zinc-binding domain-containing protein n=1 Tax=Trifolium subterraneum TaxID=3900 RepID=A0A2Z6MGK2_TRISU|nr:hypothetical protein TSUD_148930 [Trifolium subterraneum]